MEAKAETPVHDSSTGYELLGRGLYGHARDVRFQGDRGYACIGSSLFIINMSDDENPEFIGSCDMNAYVWRINVDNDYAYMIDGSIDSWNEGQLHIIDISDETDPFEVGRFDTGQTTNDLRAVDDYVYLACDDGLRIIDCQDPEDPQEVGSFSVFLGDPAHGVDVQGDYAFLAHGSDGLIIIDVRDKTDPVEVGRYDTDSYARDVTVQDDYAYVADGEAFLVVDIEQKDQPSLSGSSDTSDGSAWGVFAAGDHAYVLDDMLRIIDVSNEDHPREIGTYDAATPIGVHVQGDVTMIACGNEGIIVLDTEDKEDPQKIGSFESSDQANDVYIQGDYAFIADNRDGLRIIDILDKSNPIEISRYDTDGEALGVYVRGDFAYVADGSQGLRIIRLTDIHDPQEIGSFDTINTVRDVYFSKDVAYLADGEGGLRIIDVRDKTHPSEIGSFDTLGSAQGLFIQDEFAYVADDHGGLVIINITDPAIPLFASTLQTGGDANDICGQDNYVFVGDGNRGVICIDVSNPYLPNEVSYIETRGSPVRVQLFLGQYVYVADADGGISLIQTHFKMFLDEYGYFDTAGSGSGVYSVGKYVYVADAADGLYILGYSLDGSDQEHSKNLELVSRPTNGGIDEVFVLGDTAYAGIGSSLFILDISDRTDPRELGRCDITGYISSINVQGDYAYVIDGGLHIIDVSDKTDPYPVGSENTMWSAQEISVHGDYAYICNWDTGLTIVDIRDKTHPDLIGYYNSDFWAFGVHAVGDYAYLTDANLHIYDVRNKKEPVEVSTFECTEGLDVYVEGDYAYVADDIDGLLIIDITDKTDPVQVGLFGDCPRAEKVFVDGDYAYVSDFDTGMWIIDISDKEDPVGMCNIPAQSSVENIFVSGDHAYVADWGECLSILDITDKGDPVEVGRYDTTASAYGIHVSGDHAYVTDTRDGLQVIDISDIESPEVIGVCDPGFGGQDVFVHEDYAYVASGGGGLRIIDVIEKDNPEEVAQLATLDDAEAVFVEGDHAYIADRDGGLRIIDISNKKNPSDMGFLITSDDAWDVFVQDDYAYVAIGRDGMQIIDVSNKWLPVAVGHYQLDSSSSHGVYVDGNYAYVAYGRNGLRIVDITNKLLPVEVGYFIPGGIVNDVFVSENNAYILKDFSGVEIINITDKENPEEVGYYETGGNQVINMGVFAREKYVYVAYGGDGVYILGFNLNDRPVVENADWGTLIVHRTNTVMIYANATDNQESEGDLTCKMKYRSPEGNWVDVQGIVYIEDHWEASVEFSQDAECGLYYLWVEFTDSHGESSGWYTSNNPLEVLNNVPWVDDLSYGSRVVERTESLSIFINGSDIEEGESELVCVVQSRSPSGSWVNVDDVSFSSDHWTAMIATDMETELGLYDFRISLTDRDGDTTGWVEQHDQVEITENQMPMAFIDTIDPNPALDSDLIYFTGFGMDDGMVTEYVWTSTIDGELHSGASPDFSISGLSIGTHIIGLRVRDDHDTWSDEDTMNVIVHERPHAIIDSISPRPALSSELLTFTGAGTDDGTIEQYTWWSSIDGDLYNASDPQFQTTLMSNGTHTISLRVKDNYGVWSAEVSTEININGPPIAIIDLISPNPAMQGESVDFFGYGIDDQSINSYTWTSSIDGIIYVGDDSSFSLDSLSPGTHVISLKVSDEHGIWSKEAQSVLIITPASEPPILVILYPQNDDTLSGEVSMYGLILHGDDIKNVQVTINGEVSYAILEMNYWYLTLDTGILDDGDHILFVRGYDGVSYTNVSTISIHVENAKKDTGDGNFTWSVLSLVLGIALLIIVFFIVLPMRRDRDEYAEDYGGDEYSRENEEIFGAGIPSEKEDPITERKTEPISESLEDSREEEPERKNGEHTGEELSDKDEEIEGDPITKNILLTEVNETRERKEAASEPNICSTCGEEMKFIPPLKKWYCHVCKDFNEQKM